MLERGREKKQSGLFWFHMRPSVAAAEICRGVHGYPSTPQLFNQL